MINLVQSILSNCKTIPRGLASREIKFITGICLNTQKPFLKSIIRFFVMQCTSWIPQTRARLNELQTSSTPSPNLRLSIDLAPTRRGIYTGVSGNSDFDTKTCRKAFILYDYHDSISIAVQYFNRVKHSQVIPIHAMYTYVTIYNMEQSDCSTLLNKLI